MSKLETCIFYASALAFVACGAVVWLSTAAQLAN